VKSSFEDFESSEEEAFDKDANIADEFWGEEEGQTVIDVQTRMDSVPRVDYMKQLHSGD
jgi:hypothetical protein